MSTETFPAVDDAAPVADERPTVLVVDDMPVNLTMMGELLRPLAHVRVATSGPRALKAAVTDPLPDLILLDIMMPGMDGWEVIRRLRDDPRSAAIPVIFVTTVEREDGEGFGLAQGAVDYVTKPVRPPVLLARVRTQLELKRARDRLSRQNEQLQHVRDELRRHNEALEAEVARRLRENDLIKDVSLHAMALLAESRDQETGNHLHRTQAYVDALAAELQRLPRFAAVLDDAHRRMIAKAAPLHDIGKVGVPDEILLKPGRLTPAEFEVMKHHPRIGAEAITTAMDRVARDPSLGQDPVVTRRSLEFLDIARQITLHHHERWDGTGYPDGLAGEAIPLPARLMALADVFDALSCWRVYKAALPMDEVARHIRAGRGNHFDPAVVDAYLAVEPQFFDIARRFADPDPGPAPPPPPGTEAAA